MHSIGAAEMLATVSSLLRLLIWETDKVFALVFVRVYILNARIRHPLAISNNEMTFPGFQPHRGVISQQCFNFFLLLWKAVHASQGLRPVAQSPPTNDGVTPQ